jgi:hypothetical protein
MRSSLLAATAAASLILGSTAASAQVAAPAPAPAQVERAGAAIAPGSELRGRTGLIVAAIVIGLLIWGGIELFGNDDDEPPTSP